LLSISFVGRSPAKQKDHPLAKNTSDPYFRDKANAIKKRPPTLVGIRDKAMIKRKRRLNVKQTL